MPKRRTVTKTKAGIRDRATKKVVVRGKDGAVKRTKYVEKGFNNKEPTRVTKSKKNKDGTTTTKKISRRGTDNTLQMYGGKVVGGSVTKAKRKVTKQRQTNVTNRGTGSPQGAVGAKKRTVTKTKAEPYKKATKKVVVRGKDGKVTKTKKVFKTPSKSYGPTYVDKSKKNKDGTITNKQIFRSGIKRKVLKTRDFPLPPSKY
jgi:hypothetical protein|tara:strand:- start:66 stop:671 length:606 start_codon:yes stop_codon:yes gene_type:complete